MSIRYSARPQGLRHELILTQGSQELLIRLQQDCETPQTKQFFQQTLKNWRSHNLMNCIKIDANSCPELFDIFRNANTVYLLELIQRRCYMYTNHAIATRINPLHPEPQPAIS
jgi:hypothetical protein